MKDSYNKNMDVEAGIEPKTVNRISPPSGTGTIDSRPMMPSSFRHPSEKVMDSLQRFLRYGDPASDTDIYLGSLIAGLSRYCELPENHIHTFPETYRAVETIIRAFVKPGDSVLICRPAGNEEFRDGIQRNIKPIYHDGATPFLPDPTGIIDAIADNTKLIYLANPNLCTGTIYSIDEIETIVDRTSNVRIILDETYYEYYGTSLAGLIRQYDNLIVIRTFSAAFGLGDLPCSYILTAPENIAAIKRIKPIYIASPPARVAAAAVLSDYDYLKNHVNTVRENMTYLSVRLRGLGVRAYTTPADFLLIDVANPVQVVSRLKTDKIKARDLSRHDRLQNYIAIPVIDDSQTARIVDAFTRMPGQYYRRRQTGRKLILPRYGETMWEKTGIKKPEHV